MKQLIVILIITAAFFMAKAQTKTIYLWPEGVPGSIENRGFIETTDSLDNWIKTRFVTNPRFDFYPAKKELATSTAVVVCPGGGYWGIAIDHEGKQTAEWLNSIGISAFVLKYRLPDDAIMKDKTEGPLQDAQQAIRIIRRRAKEWNIDPAKIGIMGYSAGGHLASTLSTHYDDNVYEPEDGTSARPDFSILIYPVITMDKTYTHMGSREALLGKNPTEELVKRFSNELQVNSKTPPAFLVHSLDDGAVPYLNSVNYTLALRKHNVPCELHLYEQGGHGYGLGRSDKTESSWPGACRKWLESHGLVK
ncbi:MAG: alpha/beta hydrolase [Prolixibacteraceae bacterium]|nr:alpha/beta hydrolase [Prolixibacteraceae bacterium]